MALMLSSNNFLDYLTEIGLAPTNRAEVQAKTISARNFNLIVRCPGSPTLLMKQATVDQQGRKRLLREFQLQQLVRERPAIQSLAGIIPQVLHCDPQTGIVVNRFFEEYQDLSDYYDDTPEFAPEIAEMLGRCIGEIHGRTWQQPELEQAVLKEIGTASLRARQFMQKTERLHSAIFSMVPLECLRFYKLYQQFPSLAEAVRELAENNQACCLVHNDLKLSNILIHQQWAENLDFALRPIDWETTGWGDPAGDLGSLLASYLDLWLDGLIVGAGLSMAESLQLATVPLEALQPSLLALMDSYFRTFPQILAAQPQFLDRVLQHTGLALISRIESNIDYNRTFGNQSIVTLQVAKQLLCTPKAFIQTMFGTAASQLPITDQ
jgi:thiamine kinase-like enzyme